MQAINLGNRQKNRERDKNVISVPYNTKLIHNLIASKIKKKYRSSKLYGEGNSSNKIVKIIKKIIWEIYFLDF